LPRAWADIYTYVVRPIAIYVAALIAVRLMGKRALGQLSLFDLVVMVGIGDIIVLVGLERQVEIVEGLIMLGILGGLELFLSLLTFRWRWFARLVEGQPTVLVRDGKPIRRNMLREHISLRDLQQELRKKGLEEPDEAKEVVLEACGKISVIPREEYGPTLARMLGELAALRRELASLAERIGGKEGGP